MSRPLTEREAAVLSWMVDHGATSSDEMVVTAADRARWRAQLPSVRAGQACGCGTCPSIRLTDGADVTSDVCGHRVVLEAGRPGAMLLLLVDDDRLSYLELAPTDGEHTFGVFPPPEDINGER